MKHIILSSQMTKDMGVFACGTNAFNNEEELIKVDFCPKQVYAKHIADSRIESHESLSEKQKRYFKSKCLGESIDDDLERQGSGSKKVAHKRIDERVDDFRKLIAERGLFVCDINVNMPLTSAYKIFNYAGEQYKVWLKDSVDLFPTVMDFTTPCAAEVVITKNVETDFFNPSRPRDTSSGCWGSPHHIAKNKPLFSHYMMRNLDKEIVLASHLKDLENGFTTVDKINDINTMITDRTVRIGNISTFFYLVFGHDPKTIPCSQQRVIEYSWNKNREAFLAELITEVVNRYIECEHSGWEAKPIQSICKTCPIDCKFKNADIKL